jgi:hypothetical protein
MMAVYLCSVGKRGLYREHNGQQLVGICDATNRWLLWVDLVLMC